MTDQIALPIKPAVHRIIDDVEMGILEDGTPYLSARGLAGVCGVVPSVVITLTREYSPTSIKNRDETIRNLLAAQQADTSSLSQRIVVDGTATDVFSEASCLAILEYYAFESKVESQIALRNYRALARAGFRAFVYHRLGYDPDEQLEVWRRHHERLSRQISPADTFSVFEEMAGYILEMIRAGLYVGPDTVPDISVGKTWGLHWTTTCLNEKFGNRYQVDFTYPDDFPQADAGPQQMWVYPESALAAFRKWMREVYLPEKFPNYMKRRVRNRKMTKEQADQLIEALVPKQLTDGSE